VLRLQARSSFARTGRGRLEPVGRVRVATHPDPLPLQPPARGADVLSLKRERTMYSVTGSARLDDVLELAAPLNEGPPAPAVSGAWAAIESLLYHPGDKAEADAGRAIAADRLAALVTCSWPRAELTALSYRHLPTRPDDLSRMLERTSTNAERCGLVAQALREGAPRRCPGRATWLRASGCRACWPTRSRNWATYGWSSRALSCLTGREA
jgi:hypothetical protein